MTKKMKHDITNDLDPGKRKLVRKIEGLFALADRQAGQFRTKSALRCIEGCGRCCENPRIETTVTELLPLALELWRTKTADHWLAQAASSNDAGRCVFFQPDPVGTGKGRCGVYPFRPLVCRLYGFSANADKFNRLRLITCSIIKAAQPKEMAQAQKLINQGTRVPKMTDFAMRVSQLDPIWGGRRIPINEAVRSAVECIGFALQMSLSGQSDIKAENF